MANLYEVPKDDDPLTPDEIRLLSDALGDGFRSIYLSGGEFLELTGIIPEAFWGTRLQASEKNRAQFEEYAKELRSEGWNEDTILEEYLDNLDDDSDDGAPKWRVSNPFNFDYEKLERFFVERCDKSLGDRASYLIKNGGELTHFDFIEEFPPFSRTWFEIQIVNEFSLLRTYFNDFQREGRIPSFWVAAIMRMSGAIGRMIESYRWRFAYGHHALRGQKVVKSAVAGGRARAKELSATSIAILKGMAPLIKQGHSISRAAALVHARGMGASDQANIKLWHRHKTK